MIELLANCPTPHCSRVSPNIADNRISPADDRGYRQESRTRVGNQADVIADGPSQVLIFSEFFLSKA